MPLPKINEGHYSRHAAAQILKGVERGQPLDEILLDPLLPGLVEVAHWINIDLDGFGQAYHRLTEDRVLDGTSEGSHLIRRPGGGLCPARKPGPRLLRALHRFCLLGATDDELPKFLEISPEEFQIFYATDKKFREALLKGREEADARVAQSLFKKATGYSHKEDKIFLHEGQPVVVPTVKHYPPSDAAISLWLRNRQKNRWRDKTDLDIQGAVRIVACRDDEAL